MSNKYISRLFISSVVIIFAALNLLSTNTVSNENNNSCLESGCHENLTKGIMHEPAKVNCLNCHNEVKSGHPDNAGSEYGLINDIKSLCVNCHKDTKPGTYVHEPYANGQCISCHNPHNSESTKLMSNYNGKLICYKCHDLHTDINTNVHQPVSQGQCLKCHQHHKSEFNSLLRMKEKDVCLSCHNRQLKSGNKIVENIKMKLSSKFVHNPLTNDECSLCHNPHASSNDALVIFEFHDKTYVYEREKSAGLCFSCHSEDIISESNSGATHFRNGDLNLHFVHVNREKSRNCTICHDIHGSGNPFGINNDTKFGKWDLPINFSKSENGGTCSSGCHKTSSYKYDEISLKQKLEAKPGLINKDTTGILNCDLILNDGYDYRDVRNLRFYIFKTDSLLSKRIDLHKRTNFKIQNLPIGEYVIEVDKKDLKNMKAKTENPKQKFRITGSSSISTVNLKFYIFINDNLKNNNFK